MFATASQIGKPYKSTNIPQMDVSFRPLTQPSGKIQYVALIESEETLREMDNHEENAAVSETIPPKPDIFSLGKDPIKTFYIGSVTVIGLFILYRILNKNK